MPRLPRLPPLHRIPNRLSHTLPLSDKSLLPLSRPTNPFSITPPHTHTPTAQISLTSPSQLSSRLASLTHAHAHWSRTPLSTRISVLTHLHTSLLAHVSDFATIISTETGKPPAQAHAEVMYAASYIKWNAQTALHLLATHDAHMDACVSYTKRLDMGCVYAITPFNFPLALMVRQIIPALVAGCVVLAKPSEKTPLSCIALHELCTRSLESNDIYDSPLEIVISTQPASLSEHLINDARIHMLAFIGSSQTGRALAQMAARKGKRMLAELGGNAPCVVYNDADVRKSVAEIVQSKMRNSGQACVAVNRVYVHAEVYEEFCEGVLEEVKRVPMGSYGPLISEAAAERVCGVIEEAVAKGARVIQGGEVHGCFVEICVLRDCEDGMRVFEEEVFGPVIAISKFEGEEVWERANGTDGSLAAFLFTRDLERVLGQRLRYGMVGVNTIRVSDPSMAFGSFGETWREGGMACLDPYLTTQNVVVAV